MAANRPGNARASRTFRVAALLPALALLAGCTQALAGSLAGCAERITGSPAQGSGYLISFPSKPSSLELT